MSNNKLNIWDLSALLLVMLIGVCLLAAAGQRKTRQKKILLTAISHDKRVLPSGCEGSNRFDRIATAFIKLPNLLPNHDSRLVLTEH